VSGTDFRLREAVRFQVCVDLIELMAPWLSSVQHTLHFFEVEYVIKRYKFTNENNISMRMSGLCD